MSKKNVRYVRFDPSEGWIDIETLENLGYAQPSRCIDVCEEWHSVWEKYIRPTLIVQSHGGVEQFCEHLEKETAKVIDNSPFNLDGPLKAELEPQYKKAVGKLIIDLHKREISIDGESK